MNIGKIAEMAGVSRAAVSRYLNNGYISEEKREAIRLVVEKTGYRPSVQAQTLRTKRTKMIGVIVPKIASASIGRIVEGILSMINENGYQMLLAVTQNDPKMELEYLDAFGEKQVDGVILLGTVFQTEHKKILKNFSVPVVIVGQQMSGYNCVFHDDYHAFYDLTKLFLERGRTKLGYIGAIQQDVAVGSERYRAFCDAVRDMGHEELVGRHVTASFSIRSGYEKAGEILARYQDLDGLICATDTMAAGVQQYLREQGIKVPEQILLGGQGDAEIARVAIPSLITLHYSYEKSGEIAVQMLMETLADKEEQQASKEMRLGYHIVEA